MYRDFLPVIIFTVLAIALVALPLFIQYIVSPRHNKNDAKQMSYECGEVPEGSAWIKFNVRFYVIALIFIIFDVEVIFLLGLAILVKLVPSFFMAIFDIKIRDIFAAGFLLSARFSLIIAMAEIGVELGLLSQQVESEIIFLAALTATFAPIGYRFFSIKK